MNRSQSFALFLLPLEPYGRDRQRRHSGAAVREQVSPVHARLCRGFVNNGVATVARCSLAA
jgi:hypothetical protein